MTAATEGRSRRYHDAELRRVARLNRVLYVLMTLDADQVARPDVIRRMIGYF